MTDIKLEVFDPTVWGKCPKCTRTGTGVHVGNYFAKAYPRQKLGRSAQDVISKETCENCGTQMELLYEVK